MNHVLKRIVIGIVYLLYELYDGLNVGLNNYMGREIEWFEVDGCLGGQRGLVFDLETNLITKWNGVVEKLSENNISDVQWCIEMNVKEIKERIIHINYKLNQKETKTIKIDSGYKITEPLNEKQRTSYITKLRELESELDYLESISLNI